MIKYVLPLLIILLVGIAACAPAQAPQQAAEPSPSGATDDVGSDAPADEAAEPATPKLAEGVLATVNGVEVSQEQVDAVLAAIPEADRTPELQTSIVNNIINDKLVIDAAGELGIVVSDDDLDAAVAGILESTEQTREGLASELEKIGSSMTDFQASLRDQLVVDAYVKEVVLPLVDVTSAEIDQYYLDNLDKFTAGEGMVRLRVLLVPEQEITDLIYDAIEGGDDFGTLANEFSLHPSGDMNGDVGFVSFQDLEAAFGQTAADVVFQLDEYMLSEPVETDDGWYIFLREQDVVPKEELHDAIEAQIYGDELNAAIDSKISELKAGAEIVTG